MSTVRNTQYIIISHNVPNYISDILKQQNINHQNIGDAVFRYFIIKNDINDSM